LILYLFAENLNILISAVDLEIQQLLHKVQRRAEFEIINGKEILLEFFLNFLFIFVCSKSSANRQHRNSSSSKRSTIYDEALKPKADTPPPLPDHEQDIILFDNYDEHDHQQIQRFLTDEIRCPIKLITTKQLLSENKTKNSIANAKPTYYYYPIDNPSDIISVLRWQNEENPSIKPLIVYANILDAHDAAKQNFDNDQFCLLRVHFLDSGPINGTLLPQNRLQLNNPSATYFDHMWIYVYDLH